MAAKNGNGKVGAVMVVGAGIAGIQASLDLAESGFYVHLVDKSPTIGGIMPQLDKTFPTNDCSMCIVSPKLVECGRHLNINKITNTELSRLEGEPGHFKVELVNHPRYIDFEKCTGCGVCKQHCPVTAVNEFNEGLNRRAATYIKYPQAVPLAFAIDRKTCIGCGLCEKMCLAKAIVYDQEERKTEIEVGAVILALGNEVFNPSSFEAYSYAHHPNVVTSLEFERILSASGPYQGHLMRPYDREEPKRIAWLQCVGSRDVNHCDNPYCSAVCCMYAIKEAVIAKEHAHEPLETTIFFMDMRTYGKDFEKYYNRAKDEHGVRFVRSRIHSVNPIENGNLKISYVQENGQFVEEEFEMVVLSAGFQPSGQAVELAERLGIELNAYHFAETNSFEPVQTSREGIYVCGAFRDPKDIPISVMEASAAAAAAATPLVGSRFALTKIKQLPEEKDFRGEKPRVGVFVCNCGINIGGYADVPAVREYARGLPFVVHVEDNLFTCSQDTQEKIREVIKEKDINRVVVASCSPRTHEPMFQQTIREAGLNKYLFEMANIRDQNTWVHQKNKSQATAKAKDLVRMAVAKATLLDPLQQVALSLNKAALVIGGGVAGMSAALNLADQGFAVALVEKTDRLGGNALKLRATWRGEDIGTFVQKITDRVLNHPLITTHFKTLIEKHAGFIGNFETVLAGIDDPDKRSTFQHGVTIIATGGRESKPTEYLYGEDLRVRTALELDSLLKERPEEFKKTNRTVFIQCVGSREPERPYCSKLCCSHSVESAIYLKKLNPEMEISILYRDIRTYGFRESLYQKAREMGILFIRYDLETKPQVIKGKDELEVLIVDPILGREVVLPADLLVLASAILPNEVKEDVADKFKVSQNAEGFFLEAHMKLRPVDFGSEGLFLCGLAHYPKPIDEAITQAQAAAARAVTILAKDFITVGGIVAVVDPEKCAVCLTCVRTCPFNVPYIGQEGAAVIDPATCHGCGACVAECPGKAIRLQHFTDTQLTAKVDALLLRAIGGIEAA